MKVKLMSLILGFICLMTIAAMASPADKYTSADYFKLLKQAEKQDPKLDFTALRLSYTKTKFYEPYDTPDFKGMKAAYDAKNWKKTLSISEGILKKNVTNIDAQLYAMLAYKELGNKKKADFHQYMFRGLLHSLLNSGEGDSPREAFVVISIHEEYAVFKAIHVMPGKQKLEQIDGSFYDKWQVKHSRTGDHTLYFNIDIPFKTMEARMNKVKKKK